MEGSHSCKLVNDEAERCEFFFGERGKSSLREREHVNRFHPVAP